MMKAIGGLMTFRQALAAWAAGAGVGGSWVARAIQELDHGVPYRFGTDTELVGNLDEGRVTEDEQTRYRSYADAGLADIALLLAFGVADRWADPYNKGNGSGIVFPSRPEIVKSSLHGVLSITWHPTIGANANTVHPVTMERHGDMWTVSVAEGSVHRLAAIQDHIASNVLTIRICLGTIDAVPVDALIDLNKRTNEVTVRHWLGKVYGKAKWAVGDDESAGYLYNDEWLTDAASDVISEAIKKLF